MHICTEHFAMALSHSVSRERIYIREMKNKRSTTQTVPRIILGQIDFSALPFEHICFNMYMTREIACVLCAVVGCCHITRFLYSINIEYMSRGFVSNCCCCTLLFVVIRPNVQQHTSYYASERVFTFLFLYSCCSHSDRHILILFPPLYLLFFGHLPFCVIYMLKI